ITLNGSDTLTNFSQGGRLTVAAGRTAALARFTNTASGQMTVNGTANTSDFVNYGVVTVSPGGAWNNAGGDVTLGGGSRTFSGSGQMGGVNNYTFQISNADGPAGPAPDGNNRVSGYGLVDVHPVTVGQTTIGTGDFAWTATPSAKLAFAVQTLADPAAVGDN